MTVKLSSATLANLPAKVAGPKYDRSSLKAGIVHFGVGNFHRSHQAVYLDDLFNAGLGHDWALIGAGVFAGEKAGREKQRPTSEAASASQGICRPLPSPTRTGRGGVTRPKPGQRVNR